MFQDGVTEKINYFCLR